MLKLRPEHLLAFEAQIAAMFTARALAHVKAVWPTECAELGDGEVTEIVRKSIGKAAGLGFAMEYDIIRFVDLAFILAVDFDTNPLAAWTLPIFADRKLQPTARMDAVYQRMAQEFEIISRRKGSIV